MIRCSVKILSILSFILSVWGILVYEFNVLDIPGYTCINGWPETAKSLSYGVISGWIIYLITVGLPYYFDWQNSQESVKEKLVELNLELTYFIKSTKIKDDKIQYISLGSLSNESIISAKSYAYILYQIPWYSIFPYTNVSYVEQAFIILKKIRESISEISLQNRGFLTDNQHKYFDNIYYFFLQKNWNIKDNEEKEKYVKELIGQIVFPLQKSLGIPL